MNKIKSKKVVPSKQLSIDNNFDFPIIRIGVKKSIAGMWPNAK